MPTVSGSSSQRRIALALVAMALVAIMGATAMMAAEEDVGGAQRVEEMFVRADGGRFYAGGHPLYVNGFNAYYLAYFALESPSSVSSLLQQAAETGLTLCRTWAFNDAAPSSSSYALQYSPGHYNHRAFQALDFVLAESRRLGIRLILTLANNYPNFGGKTQYVQWARDAGVSVASDDEFFTHPTIKSYYKNYVKYVLTRVNTLTGIAYKDDPTIFAWELMNEPQCPSDQSGDTLHAWISEMSSFVKSVDEKHMVEAGLEGWYGASTPSNLHSSSMMGLYTGTDFVRYRNIPTLDFTTVHCYPDIWLPQSSFAEQLQFLQEWVEAHINDAGGKPVLFTEFGYSERNQAYSEENRENMFAAVYGPVYASAAAGGAAAGALVWQLSTQELRTTLTSDGYDVDLSAASSPVTALVAEQSHKLSALSQ